MKSDSAQTISKRIKKKLLGSARTIICIVKAKMLALVDPNPVHRTRRHEPADRRGGSVQ
jgi:hypothetical protein